MENQPEEQVTQNEPVDVVEVSKAELDELRKKAEVSEQNFARLKKIEADKKELEAKINNGESSFDPSRLEKTIEEKVSLRLSGLEPDQIAEIERYAKGAGVSLAEAAKSPFVQSALEAAQAKKKSLESTPAPSSKIKVFNGKPVDEVFSTGTDAEKQAAWEASIRGGVKSNE